MNSPVLKEFIPGQENLLVTLLQQASRRWSAFVSGGAALEQWKWKHLENPLGPSHISVAVDENLIVGGFHSIPLRFKIGNNCCLVTYDTDLAVTPTYRRQGLYYKLEELSDAIRKREGIEFSYWITQNPFMAQVYERRFDHMPLKLTKFIKIVDAPLHLRMKTPKNSLTKLYGYRLFKLGNRLRNAVRKIPAAGRKISISEVDRFDGRADDFSRAAAQPFTVIGRRNADFLNWRFLDARAGSFNAKMAVENGRMTAFIVIKVERTHPRYPEAYIADMLALPERLDAMAALLCHALEDLHRLDINAVHCMLPKSSPYARLLMQCGFLDTRLRDTVFVKFIGSDRTDPREIFLGLSGIHHLSYADFDLI